MWWKYILYIKHRRFLPGGVTRVFTKREETSPGKFFLTFSGKNVVTVSPGKVFSCESFPGKCWDANFVKV